VAQRQARPLARRAVTPGFSVSATAKELSTFLVTKPQILPISSALLGHYAPAVDNPLFRRRFYAPYREQSVQQPTRGEEEFQ
jgi:hypothetical protein